MTHKNQHKYPTHHIIGFILSLVLTFGAMWVGLYTHLANKTILSVIIVLAVLQAALQLIMFMHITESENKVIQIINILFGIMIALTVAVGSIWVMTSM